jgi:hypothetical protein
MATMSCGAIHAVVGLAAFIERAVPEATKARSLAERNRKALLGWIVRFRLDSMIKVGKVVRKHLWGILKAIMLKVTNAIAEFINATIQKSGLPMLPSGVSDSEPTRNPEAPDFL